MQSRKGICYVCERNDYYRGPVPVHTSFTIQLHCYTSAAILQGKTFEKKNFVRFTQQDISLLVQVAPSYRTIKSRISKTQVEMRLLPILIIQFRRMGLGIGFLFYLDESRLLSGSWAACSFGKFLILQVSPFWIFSCNQENIFL